MKTIILPGYSPHNLDWALDVKNKLKSSDEIIVHQWEHWSRESKRSFSPRREIAKITSFLGSAPVNLIAKSVGTRIAMHLIISGTLKLNKLILCGIPTKGDEKLLLGEITIDRSKNIYAKALKTIDPRKIIIIQNSDDPFARFRDIKKFVGIINPRLRVIKKDRVDHNYPYFEDFSSFLS